jgi:glutamine synthetase
MDGIRRALDPGDPLTVDPAVLSDTERLRLNVARLPSSLQAALDALAADSVLMDALGPLRSAAYLAVKRSEAAHFASRDVQYECRQHWLKF